MGIRLIEWALDDTPADLSPREKLALVAIAHRARDSTLEGWPGIAEIARRIGASERTAKRVVTNLVDRGLLDRVGGGHRGQSTVYRFPTPKGGHSYDPLSGTGKGDTAMTPISDAKGCHPEPERVSSRARKGVTAMSPQPSGTRQEPSPRARETYADAIDYVAAGLEQIDGRRRYDRRDITETVTGFLRGKQVAAPTRYVRKAFDNNPEQFRPSAGPPRFNRHQEGTSA